MRGRRQRSGKCFGRHQDAAQEGGQQQPSQVDPAFATMPAIGAQNGCRGFEAAPKAFGFLEGTQVTCIGIEPVTELDTLTRRGLRALQMNIPAVRLQINGVSCLQVCGPIAALFQKADHATFDGLDLDFE
jgi:hypothetical protein